ncbi:flagellar hook-basal body complex protein FliE [bacterium]|jgi:flagellar hook-basal body complex protein FliE|nr:flagellar hook-basal body complex protein FliE [bacterium]MBR1619368.1 flagellar hook-basal body complex protein FliE [bacterium]
MTSYFPNYDLAGRIQHTKFASGFNMPSIRFDRVEKPETQDFKQVFSGLVENFNKDLNAPDDLLKDVMQGNKNVDIHDVMVAMSKTEISVNVATQAVGKVINAYDRVMQINV